MRTILLIDDDKICRDLTAEMLRGWQWQVIQADSGDRGIELAIECRPDVILCDLLMPRGNGYQVCRAVREHMELRHTKIIVISGQDFPADRKAAMDEGADEYLVKPLDLKVLRETLLRIGLPPEKKSQPPAQPPSDGAHKIETDSQAMVKFWGVRGSIPTPGPTTVFFGGNTSCLEVRADGELIILDAGSGIRPLGLALAEEFLDKPLSLTVLISHTHWDHIQGFPFFLPAYNPRNQLRILGYEGARASLSATLAGQMESPYFPIALKQMPGNILIEELRDMEFRIGKIRVETCFSNHPGVCVGYRLFTSSGSIVYLPDNEWSFETCTGDGKGMVPCTVATRLLDFIRDAEVLVIDAQYDHAEYLTHIGWGHGCVDDVVKLAVEAGVKRLFLFHHDPAHDDHFVSAMLAHAKKLARELSSTLEVEAAREGERVMLESAVAAGV